MSDEPLPPLTPFLLLKGFAKRSYALVLLCICATLCFISMRFLSSLLLERQAAPTEIVQIPRRLDARVLAASSSASHTEAAINPPRGPLAHFHEIPNWFQPDPGNNCTLSGCHAPLPHGHRVEVRAFLNMHATFVDCSVCHVNDVGQNKNAQWFSLTNRRPRPAPAVLQLANAFSRWGDNPTQGPKAIHDELLPLMRQALEDSGGDAQLYEWVLRLETTYVGSHTWDTLVAEIRENLHLHAHGEYNAKIGLYQGTTLIGNPTDSQQSTIKEYLRNKDTLSEQQKQALLKTVHERVLPSGALCTPCHSSQPTRVDFGTLGYPPARIESLQSSPTVKMMLGIEHGEPFYLPRIIDTR